VFDRRAASATSARDQCEPLAQRTQPGLAAVENERHIDATILGVEVSENNMESILRAPKLAYRLLGHAHSTNEQITMATPVWTMAWWNVQNTDNDNATQAAQIKPVGSARVRLYNWHRLRRRLRRRLLWG
jgi:hypothetical protein